MERCEGRRPRRGTDAAGVLLAALVVSVAATRARADEKEGVEVHYGDRGLEIGTRDGRYTSFSSSGGGELERFPADVAERYDVRQAVAEVAWQQRGFSGLSAGFPSPLEVAARVAFVDPDTASPDNRRRELTFGANWFFAGHRNKLTADTSHLSLETPVQDYSVWRVRLQWDVSF